MPKLFKNPSLFAYLAGNFLSVAGTWGQRVVVFWLAWDLTHSTAFLGLLSALDLLPSVIAAPIAGALADRRSGLRLARNVQLLSALPSLAMVGAATLGSINATALLVLTLAGGVLNGLDHPLRLLIVGSIVPREQVPSAVAANSVVFNVARMLGPALGGWVVSLQAPALIFGYNAVSFLIFAAVLSAMTAPGTGATPPASAVKGMVQPGWRTLARALDRPLRLHAVLFAAIAILIRPVFELLPSFSEDIAQGRLDPASIFSMLASAQGFGAIVGALAASVLMRRLGYQRFGLFAGIAATVSALLFLGSGGFVFALGSLAFLAGAVLANGIATQVALQTTLPDGVRGRALSLYTMTMRGMPALGALFVGALAEIYPLREICTALAVVMLGFAGWVLLAANR